MKNPPSLVIFLQISIAAISGTSCHRLCQGGQGMKETGRVFNEDFALGFALRRCLTTHFFIEIVMEWHFEYLILE
jgi:hypothetical protein